MKIKTIINNLDGREKFDQDVNEALAEGWQLVKRDILSGNPLNGNGYARLMLYAELVQLDPSEDPETIDPLDLVHELRQVCRGVPGDDCGTDRCPLNAWCEQLRNGGDPTDWILPEKGVPEA